MQKDCTKCHHETKPKRPTLTLKLREPVDFLDDPRWEIKDKIRTYRDSLIQAQPEIEQLSQQLADAREYRRRQAEARREVLETRRQAEERAKAVRAENERWEREQKRKRWLRLLEQAVCLGLEPSQDWNERLVLELISAKRAELRVERERAERHRQQMLKRQQELRAVQEAFEDQFDHSPPNARFGSFQRPFNDLWKEGIGNYRGRGKSWVNGSHRNGGRKQSRTWEAAAPRKWRRKQQCKARWDHLFR